MDVRGTTPDPASIRIGIVEAGLRHTMSHSPSPDECFRMLRECGVFACLDTTPPRDRVTEYARLTERHDVPILAGGLWYTLGRDEPLLEENLRIGASLGSVAHNNQILMDHADGRLVTDDEVAEAYLRVYDVGAALEPWKEVLRQLVAYDRTDRGSPLRLISVEFIPFTDYGEGAGYSLLENSVACARWIDDVLNGPVPLAPTASGGAKTSAGSVPE